MIPSSDRLWLGFWIGLATGFISTVVVAGLLFPS